MIKNIITFDLEDWFCPYNLTQFIQRSDWDKYELRIEKSVHTILKTLDSFNTKATFFVLGWIAEKCPGLIKEIEDNGHEISLHGYDHKLLTKMTPLEFENDIERSLNVLKKCNLKSEVLGYRAPSFTITEKTFWALEVLKKLNFKYDSSVFPTGMHPDYGIASAPLMPYKISDKLIEFPMSCIEIFGKRFPFGGGAYFRILPFAYNRFCIKKVNALGRAAIFYLHPWEMDPGQPRLELPFLRKLRQYHNLGKTEKRLNKLLSEFKFTTIKESLNL